METVDTIMWAQKNEVLIRIKQKLLEIACSFSSFGCVGR